MTWNADEPYNELPAPPPGHVLETRAVLRAAVGAHAAVAALDAAADMLPDQTILINVIPILEAQASSEIENIVTTADELFRFEADGSADTPAAREALRYRTALRDGHESLAVRPIINTALAERICTLIANAEIGVRTLPGTYIGSSSTGRRIYTPPEGQQLLREKLVVWERVVNRHDDLDPLIAMCVAHYQFEAIHPFRDGNGRTGRILNVLMLVADGLLRLPILYLSRYIIETKDEYYRRLLRVTSHGEWEEYLLYLLEGVRVTALTTVAKIRAIRDLRQHYQVVLPDMTRGGREAGFLDLLFERPYLRIADVVRRCDVTRQTATTWLNALAEGGLLRPIRLGREKLYLHHDYLQLLTRPESI